MTKKEIEEEFDGEDEEARLSRFAAQRRLQQNQMERKVRQSQMWLSRLRIFARFFIILLMVAVAYKLLKLPQWYLNKNVFNSYNNSAFLQNFVCAKKNRGS